MTTEEFIEKAKEVHGDNYDYTKTKFVNWKTKIYVICKQCGREFSQNPYSHLKGMGCSSCAQNLKLTTEHFIAKSKKLYPNKLKYGKCRYVNAKTNVTLYCTEKDEHGNEHGYYTVNPSNHIHGTYGCKKCQYESVRRKKTKTNEQFITESKSKFGKKFKYNKCDYKGVETDVILYCTEKDEHGNEHGYFNVKPDAHLYMKYGGCTKCHTHHHTTKSWVERAHIIHGDNYDYCKTDLENRDEMGRVLIICKQCGREFWQDPANHLQGMGCQLCNRGITKQYKFNLLEEFESEYDFRAFLANNDINILYVILRNIEPKYEPLKRDIEKALAHSTEVDPIKALRDKYTSDSEDELDEDEEEVDSNETEDFDVATAPSIDLDDDDAIDTMVATEETKEADAPTIEDVVKNTQREIKVINKIEHMLTPEDREYIMNKFLNDKRRIWIAARENRNKT